MNLELHRRDTAIDSVVRFVKVFPKWLTADQYLEIPRQEALTLSEVLITSLPAATLKELSQLLARHVSSNATDPAPGD